MKLSYAWIAALFACTSTSAVFADEVIPKGFENAISLGRLMNGEILTEELLDSDTKMRVVYRAYFKGTSPDRFVDVVTDHASYTRLFEEVQKARTVSVNANRTRFDYELDLKVKIGFLSKRIQVEARQSVTPAADLVSEWTVVNEILSNREELKSAVTTCRLIPFRNGFLIYSDNEVHLQRPSLISGTIKKRLRDEGYRQVETFRRTLRAQP